MKTFIVLFLSCVSLFAGETFVTLKSGETNHVSYGLACLVSDSWSASNTAPSEDSLDLILTLRNEGAKWMSFGKITTEDFSLRDAKGQDIQFYLRTSPDVQGIHYGEAAVIHLIVYTPGLQYPAKAPQPWTLYFKTKPGEHDYPLDWTITGIKPGKHKLLDGLHL
jgi:hypothetical protein